MIGVVWLATHRFNNKPPTKNLAIFTHVVADNIGVVHPHIQADRAFLLEVSPRGNSHGITTAERCLNHKVGIA